MRDEPRRVKPQTEVRYARQRGAPAGDRPGGAASRPPV